MPLNAFAQELIVLEPVGHPNPLSVEEFPHANLEVIEDPHTIEDADEKHLEVQEPINIEIVVDELPGAPAGTKDPEVIEVKEEVKDEDKNKLSDPKDAKWDWSKKGAHGFIAWVKERIETVPKHSGIDSAGLERAIAYLEKLDNEISKAMRSDLDSELDANKIEIVRSQIDDGLSRLHQRLDKVKKSQKSKRNKRADQDPVLIKEAQKISGMHGSFIAVPVLISGLARICINSMVSAGHDIEWVFNEQSKKYSLNKRERFELATCLNDMGYAMFQDMGKFDEDLDPTSSDNFNWGASYSA